MLNPPQTNKFIVSSRILFQKNILRSLDSWCKHHKICEISEVSSLFGSVIEHSPLYGGRPCVAEQSFPYHCIDEINGNGIGFMLTLTNHYFSDEAYKKTIPILEKLYGNKLNSIVITNDKLAIKIRKDFPKFELKASVIKDIKTKEEISKALELYDYITLSPRLNDDAALLKSIDCKDKIILFANSRCLYRCNNTICYESISRNIREGDLYANASCNNKDNKAIKSMNVFNLEDEKYKGYSLFKIVP